MNELKTLRKEAKLSQVNLAKDLSMHTTTYRDMNPASATADVRYEYGERDLPMEVAIHIADYYHVSLDYLVGRSEERELR